MAFDPDKFLAETADTSATTATLPQGGFDPDKFLAETAPAAVEPPSKEWGIVRAAKHLAQIPGAAIGAIQDAAAQGGARTVVKNAQGQLVPRSVPGQILNAESTLVNMAAAPVMAVVNKGMQIANDLTANSRGVGLLDPFSDQNMAQYAQGAGVPLNKIQEFPQRVQNKMGDEAYYNLSDLGNIAMNALPAAGGVRAGIFGTAGAAAAAEEGIPRLVSLARSAPGAVGGAIDRGVEGTTQAIKDVGLKVGGVGLKDVNANALPENAVPKNVETNILKPPSKPMLSRITDSDANLLSEPLAEKDTPFTDYALQAKKAVQNKRELTPADIAGQKAVNTLSQIGDIRNTVGQAKGEILKYNIGKTVDISDVKDAWQKMLSDRLGVAIDEDGNVSALPGRGARKPSENGMVKQINSIIDNAGDVVSVQQADDIKSAINDIVQNQKASQAKPINTVTEGIGKNIGGTIDKKLDDVLGPDYQAVNTKYRDLKDIEGQLNARLGSIVDPETGTARHGASLMKSAIQSNADRGTKALFQRVKDYTGVDLIKDAGYAEMAMRGVGDSRINNLLTDIGEVKSVLSGGVINKAMNVAGMAYNKIKGNPLDEMISYYNKKQAGHVKGGSVIEMPAQPVQPEPPAPQQPITKESQMLPAPMIDNQNPQQAIQQQMPTMRQRYEAAGTTPGATMPPNYPQLPAPGMPNQFQMPQLNVPQNSIPLSMATPTMRQRLAAIGQFQGNNQTINLANMTQRPIQMVDNGKGVYVPSASYPTLGTLSQEGDPFYQSLMTPKDFKKAQKEAKNAKQFNSQAQSINAQDYPDYNPNQLKTPDEHFMDQDYMQGFNPEQVSDVANKWKMDFKRETFPGRFEDVNYSKLKPEEQKKVRQIAERANIDSDYRRELVENQIITSDQNVHPDDVIGWANEGGHVKGGKKGGPTIGNMFNSNLGSGVNIGMPMATRAGLGGAYGYIASGPDATPQERLRNALMGAAGGAFVPTLGKMIAGKGNGAPGVLMAPPGVPPMAQYMDEAVAQQAGKLGLNYRGSLNKTTQFPALAKEQHYMNDDLGTKSSFVVHEGGDVAKELDAHRRRFWGDKYEQKMKSLNLKLTKSK